MEIYEEEIFPEEFKQKLEAFEVIQKAFDNDLIGSDVFLRAEQELEKAKKDISKLTKKKVFAKKADGHIYLTTVYVNENKEIYPDTKAAFVEVPMSAPELMVGEQVRITKKGGLVLEGVVMNMAQWFKADGSPEAKIVVDTKDGLKQINVTSIGKFEKFNSTGSSPKPEGEKDSNGYTIIKKLGGSTGAVLVEKDGVKYVKKTAANPEHLSSEMRALNYMSQIGVPVPKIENYIKGECAYLEYIEGKTLNDFYDTTNYTGKVEMERKLAEHFVSQALFANHDCVGLNYDNIIIKPDGSPVFVDVGGSMGYRAQGGIKEDWKNWKNDDPIGEFKSMLDNSINKQTASAFVPAWLQLEEISETPFLDQLLSIKAKNPKWYSNPGTDDATKLKQRLDSAIKQFSPVEEPKKPKNFLESLSQNEQYRFDKYKSIYRNEIETAKKHNRPDIAKFYEDFTQNMFIRDNEWDDIKKSVKDPSKSDSDNDQEFLDSVDGAIPQHLYAIRTHTNDSGYMNNPLRKICNGLSDWYNISFKDKNPVSFNQEACDTMKLIGDTDFMKGRLLIDLFVRAKDSKSKFYRTDATLYRGIDVGKDTLETIGKNGVNIYCDSGVSSNSQKYGSSFDKHAKVITLMAEGIDVNEVGTHPGENETIMKPFNMQQVTLFTDVDPEADKMYKNRYQVRVEAPGLIPIKLD